MEEGETWAKKNPALFLAARQYHFEPRDGCPADNVQPTSKP